MQRGKHNTEDRRPHLRLGMLAVRLLLFGVMFVPPSTSADEDAFRSLMKLGRAALEKGKADEAATKFRSATSEDKDAPDAWAWLGQALEKMGDKSGAIAAYRTAMSTMNERQRAGAASVELRDTVKRAIVRLETLAPGEIDLRRIQEVHVAELLAIARTAGEKDPATAKRCLEATLAISPADPAVRTLAETLGVAARGSAVPEGAKAPDGKIAQWDDLIARKALESPRATYDESVVTYEIRDKGEVVWANPSPEVAQRFALDVELRVLDRTANNAHAGWSFSRSGEHFFAVFLTATEVVLAECADGKTDYLAHVSAAEPKGKPTWRHVTVQVDGPKRITVSVDGKSLIVHKMTTDLEPGGQIGVWTQSCKVEYRKLRVGVP